MLLSVLLLLICLCFLLVQFSSRRPKNFPPGPIALPFLGNALNLAVDNPLGYLEMLRRTYGNVYSLYIGPRVAVVVSGTQALKEALVNKAVDFAGRPQDLFMNDITERRGVIFVDYCPAWKEHRRFALMTMRNFGLGKQSMEERILGELQYTIEKLEKSTVFIDLKMYDTRVDTSFCPDELLMSCINLHTAGSDTSSNTLLSGFLYLMTKPHIQERCQQEIDRVLEGKDCVTFEDRHNMPYVQAVLHEIQRMGDTVPLSVFHETTRDTELMGYSIPKGITIIPNLSSALNEEGQWKFPHEFNPENFLNDKGEFVKPDAFLPFSAGPRVCPGESLARMELFLIMVTLLRRFRFIWPEDAGELDYELEFGITSMPKPYNMKVELRAAQ
ncbi:cytochrome P450 2K1-like [Periophthalmus magnuspinnatus]|uniref:cytochrome P450 2K1-like n=1 Tax=Periophthalmus magnuspinnatus TaxID=409849 RepID=UPI0024363899|nr:cytochrome P450 2K1-like [Periophthalmus magnuspinnatus]